MRHVPVVQLTPADNGGIALPVTQCLHGEMGRVQCRAAGGVDGDRRPTQVKVV